MMNLLNEYELAIGQLPVEPSDNQVLYVENHYNPELELYIHRNYDRLVRMFGSFGLEFIYIPELSTRMSDEEFSASASYYCPWLKKEDLDSLRRASRIMLGELFRNANCKDDQPALVNKKGRAFKIDVSKPYNFEALFYQVAEAFGKERFDNIGGLRSKKPLMPLIKRKEADDWCCESRILPELEEDDEIDRLFREFRRTHPNWVVRTMLYEMLQKQEVISRLYINHQGKIFLPDYNYIEIKLTPKAKALYFLFLKHPEGIFFKELPDYRDELARIYRKVTRSDDPQTIEATIDYMVYTLSGDANVQRSKIRYAINKAFSNQFCQQFARYYTIEGTKGQAMKVELPQDKIIWEVDI